MCVTGLLTYVKTKQAPGNTCSTDHSSAEPQPGCVYVHTLNTESGLARKLEALGLHWSIPFVGSCQSDTIQEARNPPAPSAVNATCSYLGHQTRMSRELLNRYWSLSGRYPDQSDTRGPQDGGNMIIFQILWLTIGWLDDVGGNVPMEISKTNVASSLHLVLKTYLGRLLYMYS